MTLHEITEAARDESCACGAPPGCPCVAPPSEYHLSRVEAARAHGRISQDDIAYVIRNFLRTVPDPGPVTP
jgi:hypothetical protein